MNRIFKHKIAIAATGLAAVAFAGGAYAATQDSPSAERQAFLNDVAKHLNVSPQALNDAFKSAAQDRLQQAVKDGKLTQAQADQLKQQIQQGKGLGMLGFGMHHFGFGFHSGKLDAAAKYLGLSDTQLDSKLASGKTLAQIATSQGKSTSGLKDAMIAAEKSRLDQAVASKEITSAQEKQILSDLGTRLDDLINGKLPGPGMMFRGMLHGGMTEHGESMGSAGGSTPVPSGAPPVAY